MLKEYLTRIADTIRLKLGTTEKINAQDFADKINEVYEAGQNTEYYDEFWDAYQDSGEKVNYKDAFCGISWNNKTFKPKYDLCPTSMQNMFAYSKISDLKTQLENIGRKLDTSNCTTFMNAFNAVSAIKHIPELNAKKVTTFQNAFSWSYIVSIEKLILNSEGTQSFINTFDGAGYLQDIVIEGVIGQNLNMGVCPLTNESITSVINALSSEIDEETGEYKVTGKTVTFKKSAINNAFKMIVDDETTWSDEWEDLIKSKPNWTFGYVN